MIKLLDCTLRDGGYINNSEFGFDVINAVIKLLVDSKVEIIEAGWLRDDKYKKARAVYNNVSDLNNLNLDYNSDAEYSLFLQQNQYDVNKLEEYKGTVKYIRCAFHSYDLKKGYELCRKVIDKGYLCHVNPINILSYSEKELLDIIENVNSINPHTFTIVDTQGSMTKPDLEKIILLVESNLNTNISIGLHLHEHLASSFALSQLFISMQSKSRNISIDASLNGMGRVPGNLCIELIMQYLNNFYDKTYNLTSVYNAIDNYILPVKEVKSWGYSIPYAIAALNKVHRTYVEFLLAKSDLRITDIKNIIEQISQDKKSIFNERYIDDLYKKYKV